MKNNPPILLRIAAITLALVIFFSLVANTPKRIGEPIAPRTETSIEHETTRLPLPYLGSVMDNVPPGDDPVPAEQPRPAPAPALPTPKPATTTANAASTTRPPPAPTTTSKTQAKTGTATKQAALAPETEQPNDASEDTSAKPGKTGSPVAAPAAEIATAPDKPTTAQETAANTTRPADPIAPKVVARLHARAASIQEDIEDITRIDFVKPVNVNVIRRTDILDIIIPELDRDTPPEKMQHISRAYALMGLLPAGYPLRDAYLSLFSSQVAGFYLPTTRQLYLIDGMPLQDMITAHELMHALQDQHHDLKAAFDTINKQQNSDAIIALQSVIEGEATFLMNRFMTMHNDPLDIFKDAFRLGMQSGLQQQQLAAMPTVLRETLMFPYVQGQPFFIELMKEHHFNWAHTQTIHNRLPQSSEQILHPEKYFEQPDRPSVFHLDGLINAIDTNWSMPLEDTLGELTTSILLREHRIPYAESVYGAQGWDGDRLLYYQQSTHTDTQPREAVLWISTWDSADHAHRFLTTYIDGLTNLHGQPTSGNKEASRAVWALENRTIHLSRWGQEVLLLNGFNDQEAKAIRKELGRRKSKHTLFREDHRHDAVTDTKEQGVQRPAPSKQTS